MMNNGIMRNGQRVEEIVDHLTDEILNGPLSPAEHIAENDLAIRFGTSRGPVREALQKLEKRGLICIKPNVGARVAFYTLPDYINLFHARECMEGMAARLAAVSMSAKGKANLRQIIHEHEEQFQAKPKTIYFRARADLDFHHAIIRGSKNPILFNVLCKDLYPLFQLCRRLHQHTPGRGKQALLEHLRVLEAIEEKDFEIAEMMMRRHIAASRRCVEAIFSKRNVKLTNPELLNSRPSLLRWTSEHEKRNP